MNTNTHDFLLLTRLNVTDGLYTLKDVMDLVGKFQRNGIEVTADKGPGLHQEGKGIFEIKVTPEHYLKARQVLKETLG